MKKILCADVGTSSLKAAVIDQEGNVLASSRKKFLLTNTAHASREWFPALQNALKELFEGYQAGAVDGICISGNGPTLVTVTGETLLWNEDIAQGEFKSLFIPRFIEFKKRLGSAWNSTPWVFSGPEYLIWLLTDSACSILPEKRFFDAYWNDESLVAAGFTLDECRKFPPFVSPGDVAGTLTHKASSFLGLEEFGVKEGVPVYCGAPDFISALVGTGTLTPGIMCDRAGSSEGINFCTDIPLYGEKIRTLPSVIPGLWNSSVLLPESGFRFSAFKKKVERELGHELSYSDFVKLLLDNDGSNPSYDQGKYLMIQTALDVKAAIDVLRKAAQEKGIPFPKQITITGGQALNDPWNQMKADICDIMVCVPLCPDAELLGNAIFAFTSMGLFKDIVNAAAVLCHTARFFVPPEEN